jgi:hypothetical protein
MLEAPTMLRLCPAPRQGTADVRLVPERFGCDGGLKEGEPCVAVHVRR